MKHQDHFHCPICGAKFELETDLKNHEKLRHAQQGVSGIVPSNEYPPPDDQEEAKRKNKTFTRSHRE